MRRTRDPIVTVIGNYHQQTNIRQESNQNRSHLLFISPCQSNITHSHILQTLTMSKTTYFCTIVILLVHQTTSLHLTVHSTHLQTSNLILKLQKIMASFNSLNNKITQQISSFTQTNQTQRITALQQTIIFTRNQLYNIYIDSIISLNSTTYYSLPPSPQQKIAIQNSLEAINSHLKFLSQIPPITQSNISLHPYPQHSIKLTDLISQDMNEGGLPTSTMPVKLYQVNLLANNLSIGNESFADLSKRYQSNSTSFPSPCPLETPYLNSQGNCIYCSNYYDLVSKSCIPCNSFNPSKRMCLDDIPSTIAAQSQRITNINNLTNILLPDNMSLEGYKKSIQNNTENANFIPCPSVSPFFNGTACIYCPSNQYFSVSIQTCLTCPSFHRYNKATYHCDQLNYYSNLKNPKWISIGSQPKTIIADIKNKTNLPDWIPCPEDTPFFNQKACVSCNDPTPLFSYDSLKCTVCTGDNIFDQNIQSCVQIIHKQTNLTSPNLIFEGRSLNEWKYYYYNNLTADTQLEDCPSSKPYFDGLGCISCPDNTPYFNLQYRYCQYCNPGTAYDASESECLSNSGNRVTQPPSLMTMAADIFA